MRPAVALLALTLVALVGGCTTPRTQVMLRFEADDGMRADTTEVRLTVRSGATTPDGAPEIHEIAVMPDFWPYEAAIVPAGNDASRVFRVRAEALDVSGAVIGSVSIRTGFAAGRTLLATLRFEDTCRDRICPQGETCREGGCFEDLETVLLPYVPPVRRDAGLDVPMMPDTPLDSGGVDAPRVLDVPSGDAPSDASFDGGGPRELFGPGVPHTIGTCIQPAGMAITALGNLLVACPGSDNVLELSDTFSTVASSVAVRAPTVLAIGNVLGDSADEVVCGAFGGIHVLDAALTEVGRPNGGGIAVREVTSDGFADIATSYLGDATIYPGGAGGIAALVSVPSLDPRALAWGNSNGDAPPDLYVAGGSTTLALARHVGMATSPFLQPLEGSVNIATGGVVAGLLPIDLDRDGDDDVALVHSAGAAGPSTLVLVDNQGMLRPGMGTSTGTAAGPPCAADYDGDLVADVVVPHAALSAGGGYPVTVSFTSPSDRFRVSSTVTLTVPTAPRAVLCAEFTGDSLPDILVSHGTDAITVFPGR